MFQSNSRYYLKSTIPSTATTGGTFLLSPDFELGQNLETGTDSVSLVFKNATQIERMEVTATGGTATIVKRGLDQSSSKVQVTALKKQWLEGTVAYVAALASDILDVDSVDGVSVISSDTEFTGSVEFSGPTKLPTFADTAARDAVYTAPVSGDKCFIIGTGEQYYDGGAWHTLGVGSPTPNASDAVAGKVEIATQAETDAGTETGWTGAILAVTPKTLTQNTANITASQAEAEAWVSNAKMMTPLATQKKIDYTRASDAEALAGTDTVKFLTPKQAKDNYGTTVLASDNVLANSSAEESTTSTSYVILKEIVIAKSWTYRTYFGLRSFNSNNVYWKVYKNGVALWTERVSTASFSPTYFSEDFAFAAWDLVQLYAKISASTNAFVSDFQIRWSAFPTSGIPTVNS